MHELTDFENRFLMRERWLAIEWAECVFVPDLERTTHPGGAGRICSSPEFRRQALEDRKGAEAQREREGQRFLLCLSGRIRSG